MRKLVGLAIATQMVFTVGTATAAPVPGFEAAYAANYAACVLPDGSLEACEGAINAHVAALLGGGIDIDDANAAFTGLRAEVFAANAADPEFRAAIDALFELLLPDSGAGPDAGDAGGGGGGGGFDGPPGASDTITSGSEVPPVPVSPG